MRSRQRGSAGLYMMFALVVSAAVGFGVYWYLRQHPVAEANEAPTNTKAKESAETPAAKPKVVAPPVVEDPVVPEEKPMSLAQQRAQDPIVDPNSSVSPVFGLAGIDGAIEKGAVDRRFRPKATALQDCFEQNGAHEGWLKITMQVDAKGKITEVSLDDNGWGSIAEDCVTSIVKSISFSAPKDGKPATVVYPIAFR